MASSPLKFRPRHAVKQVCEAVAPLAREKGISLRPVILPEVEEVHLHRERFVQVVSHLVSNALKFTPVGGQVEVVVFLREQNLLELQVIDTGIGIHPERLSRLFDPAAESTGGLADTRQIVEDQGGRISALSEPGIGTVFTVQLPERVGRPGFSAN